MSKIKSLPSHRTAVLAVLYPQCKKITKDFFDSIENQTCKDFDLILVNDNYPDIGSITSNSLSIKFIDSPSDGLPSNNRDVGIKHVKNSGYEFLIFCDIDDYFQNNRVQESIELLSAGNDIVCNDLSLVIDNKVYEENYCSNRIKHGHIIDLDFIREKNILGFTNTAVRISSIDNIPSLKSDLVANDWYFFTKLIVDGAKAIFTNKTKSYYRQHEKNCLGIKKIDRESYDKILGIKLDHYKYFEHLNSEYTVFKKIKKIGNMDEHIGFIENNVIYNPFWLEEMRPS